MHKQENWIVIKSNTTQLCNLREMYLCTYIPILKFYI